MKNFKRGTLANTCTLNNSEQLNKVNIDQYKSFYRYLLLLFGYA